MDPRAMSQLVARKSTVAVIATLLVTWPIMGEPRIGMAVLLGGLTGFLTYRRARNLDPHPPGLFIGLGGVGIVTYTTVLLLGGTPKGIEWLYFALIAAVPVLLLIMGIRTRSRLAGGPAPSRP
jgi:hypothetical protein